MRFIGLMPSCEVEIIKSYQDNNKLNIVIESGKNGWTIIYADQSTDYEDCKDTAQNNFDKAYKYAQTKLGNLTLQEADTNGTSRMH